MKIFHYDQYTFPLRKGHRFPAGKYSMLRHYLLNKQIVPEEALVSPTAVTPQQVRRAHTEEYIHRFEKGHLTPSEMRRIGLEWSPQLVQRIHHMSGASIAVCRVSLREGVALSLGGGTHHACSDHGEGYCLYNDIIIAIRAMQAEGRIHTAAVIDCDVHQGNGTAEIAKDDDTIFTFSIHGEKNFPFRKIPGDWDIGLADGTEDEAYLSVLKTAVYQILAEQNPDLVVYLAGADVHKNDRLGRLALSADGMAQRDRLVLASCQRANVPVAVLMAGGYGKDLAYMVALQAETVRIASVFWENWR